MRRLLTATVVVAATAIGSAGAFASVASAAPTAAAANPQFCEAALSAYESSLTYTGKGAFPEAAKVGASVRASAQYAPAKIAKDAKRVATLYDGLAKIKNPRAQALQWVRWSAKYNKSVQSYYGYFADACMSYLSGRVPGLGNDAGNGSDSGSSDSSSSSSSGSSSNPEDE